MQTVAKQLTEYGSEEPKWLLAWAFATRRAESIEAAKTILMGAWHLHQKSALISFNLALDDEDLRPLWDSL